MAEKEIDKKSLLNQKRSSRAIAFLGVVFSTSAVTACLISFPLVFTYVQQLQASVQLDLDYCRTKSRDMWKEVLTVHSATGAPSDRIVKAMHLVRESNTATDIDFHSMAKRAAINNRNRQPHRRVFNPFGNAPEANSTIEGQFQQILNPPSSSERLGDRNLSSDTNVLLLAVQLAPQEERPGGNFTAAPPTATPKPKEGDVTCCTCHRGPGGPPGPNGNPGHDGADGEDGKPGENGKPAPERHNPADAVREYCPCEAEKGDAGPVGPKGQPGPPGNPGKPGDDGKGGDNGLRGPIGKPGQDGKPGLKGMTGDEGPVVPPGSLPPGKPGEPGKDAQGDAGVEGKPGGKGKDGKAGDNGPRGEKGICTHCPPVRTPPGF